MPPGLLLRADRVIELQGTSALAGMPFSEALTAGWMIDGGPPVPFMFGFLNGIMDPFVMSHQGPNAMSVLIFLLVWLVAPRIRQRLGIFVLAVVFAMWALVWETSYGMFALGILALAGLVYTRLRSLRTSSFQFALIALLLSIPIVFVQGGTLTETIRNEIYTRQLGTNPPETGFRLIPSCAGCIAHARPGWHHRYGCARLFTALAARHPVLTFRRIELVLPCSTRHCHI